VIVAFAAVPVAVGIAVLRYRLYDIDLLINRTVVYGSVTVVLAALFAGANIGVQRLLESVTGQSSDLVTGGLAVAAALSFGPMRRAVRPIVDRLLPGRALLTLLFTDIVGSTEAIVELGDERWQALLARFRAMVRHELGRHGGREVNTAGDAFFATFSRPAAGLRCAWAMRAAVKGLGLETRTGLHLGECEMRGEEVTGLAVHTAARVMSLAGDGEVLISDPMRAGLAAIDLTLVDRGVHQLKGVPGDWPLYAVETLPDTTRPSG
jgi:class 3 adenylate cyclase